VPPSWSWEVRTIKTFIMALPGFRCCIDDRRIIYDRTSLQ
jgi:hypothetical protein